MITYIGIHVYASMLHLIFAITSKNFYPSIVLNGFLVYIWERGCQFKCHLCSNGHTCDNKSGSIFFSYFPIVFSNQVAW